MDVIPFNLKAIRKQADVPADDVTELRKILDTNSLMIKRLEDPDFDNQVFRIDTACKWAKALGVSFWIGKKSGQEIEASPEAVQQMKGDIPLRKLAKDLKLKNHMTLANAMKCRSTGSVQLFNRLGKHLGYKVIITPDSFSNFSK